MTERDWFALTVGWYAFWVVRGILGHRGRAWILIRLRRCYRHIFHPRDLDIVPRAEVRR